MKIISGNYLTIILLTILGLLWCYALYRMFKKRPYGSKLIRIISFSFFFFGCISAFIYLRDIFELIAVIFPLIWFYLDGFLSKISGHHEIIAVLRSISPFGKEMSGALEMAVKEYLPKVSIEIMSPKDDESVSQQILCLQEAIFKKPDAIILMPSANEDKLIPSVVRALKEGIPVITIDRHLSRTEFIKQGITPPLHVASDFEAGGQIAADIIIKILHGMGNIAIISGPKESRVSQIRKLSFVSRILENSPNLKIVFCRDSNWGEEEGASIMSQLIKKNIEIDGVFCCNDSLAIGALRTARQNETFKSIPIIGYDGISEMKKLILNEEALATIDVDIDSQAKIIIREIVGILTERERYFKYHPGQILVHPRGLTREVMMRSKKTEQIS